MSAFLIWRHRANIAKLLNGTESRIGGSRSDPSKSSNRDDSGAGPR
jgi:hypothetical protein